MFNKKSIFAAIVGAMFAIVSLPASATIFNIDDPVGGGGGFSNSRVKGLFINYDDTAQTLAVDVAFNNNSWSPNGYWLVLSDGPNPKGIQDQLAIFYADAINGMLTVYSYNGQNNSTSWSTPGRGVDTFGPGTVTTSLVNGQKQINFNISTAQINSGFDFNGNSLGAQWEGAQIGNQAGWWLHPYFQTNVAYNSKGFLKELWFKKHAWYDVSKRPTTTSTTTSGQVSEPGVLALFGFGLVGMALIRRRSTA